MSGPSFFFDPHALLPHGQNSGPASGTTSDIAGKIRAIRSDPKHAYNVPTHAEHQRAIVEMNALYGRLPLPEAGLRDELDVAV
jgi:hypothetical protein